MTKKTNPNHDTINCPYFADNGDCNTLYFLDKLTEKDDPTDRKIHLRLVTNGYKQQCTEQVSFTSCPKHFMLSYFGIEADTQRNLIKEITLFNSKNINIPTDDHAELLSILEEMLQNLDNGSIDSKTLSKPFWDKILLLQQRSRIGLIANPQLFTHLFNGILKHRGSK